jgi:hypothetical protein
MKNDQSGMAITEYVIICMALVAGIGALYGIPVTEGKSLMTLMAEGLHDYLATVSLIVSLP